MISQTTCLLAEINDHRRVEWEAQAIFLCWDDRCVCLKPDAFACLNRLLTHGVLELEMISHCEGKFCLEQHRVGHFRLYLGQCCLALPLSDFLNLVQLVRLAYRHLLKKQQSLL